MASKKTGRLAGLAALAGAAYLASKGKEAKADTKADAKDTSADREDAEMGAAMRSNMAATPKMSPTSSGDFMSEKEPGWETKSAPAPKAAAARPPAAAAPKAAAAAPAKSGSRGPISGDAFDNERTGGDARRGRMDELYSSYRPRSGDAKLKDVSFNRPSEGKTASYSNRVLKSIGAEEREQSDADRYGISSAPKPAPKSGMGSTITNRPDPRAPSIYAGEEAWAKYRALQKEDKGMKRGGAVKKMASGGMTSSASKRADGIATKGKTRGKMC